MKTFTEKQRDYKHTLQIIEKMEGYGFIVEPNEDLLETDHYQYKWQCELFGRTRCYEGPVRSEPYPAFAASVIAFKAFKKLRKAETLSEMHELIEKIKQPVK